MSKKDSANISSMIYLFKTFLIVGSSSFGGYSSLVAVVRRIMVEKDKLIDDDTIMRGFSIASLLPGPVAVNTVTYIGYRLRGWSGAMISMAAVILPSMILIMILSYFYLQYDSIPEVYKFMAAVIPVVLSLIATVAFNMGKNNLKSYKHYLVLVLVLGIQIVFKGYWVFISSFLIGGILGYVFFKQDKPIINEKSKNKFSVVHFMVIALLILIASLNFLPVAFNNIFLEIGRVFSKVSLTLFGGGYVMIPMLNEILVIQKSWLSSTEFRDAISLGQITPGPILISATFIGFKLKGIWGAIIATIGIFLPSGLLMILVSDVFKTIEENHIWKAIFEGLKAVVIALIISSVLILGQTIEDWWLSGIIFGVSFILLLKFKINILWLIGFAGLSGILFL